MSRFGMVIDLSRCSTCQACSAACTVENNLPFVGRREALRGRVHHWVRMLPAEHGEHEGHEPEGTDVAPRFAPTFCGQCDDPPCAKVCPVRATYRSEESGIVGQVYWRCIGCRFCVAACPYTAKVFNWFDAIQPDSMSTCRNPDVPIRPKGVVEKCTFCSHRWQEARDRASLEGRPIADGEYVPACVESCPTGAMTFGDLDDPESKVARLALSPRARQNLPGLGTRPKLFYVSEGA